MTRTDSSPKASSAGTVRTLENYIDGQWVEAESSGELEVVDPGTGQVLAKVPLSTPAELDRAVTAARRAFEPWSRTPVSARVQGLFKLAGLLSSHCESIARTITAEMGKSLPDARAELKRTIENCQVAAPCPPCCRATS